MLCIFHKYVKNPFRSHGYKGHIETTILILFFILKNVWGFFVGVVIFEVSRLQRLY